MKMKRIVSITLSLFFLAIVVYHKWISFYIFTSSDWGFAFKQTEGVFLYNFPWVFWSDLGSVNFILWRAPISYLYGLLGVLGFGASISDKLLVFWPTLILANLASYFLIRKTTKSDLAGFIGAIVFNYNTYIFISGTAFLLYSASAWSLITFYLFILALEHKRLYLCLLSGITLFIAGSYDFRIAYITVFLLILYFLFFELFIDKFNKKKFFRDFLYFASEGVVFILLNIYWILPLRASHSLTANAILSRTLFGNEFLNILYSISLYHPFWTGRAPSNFIPQEIMPYFWLIPIFAFLGLYMNRKNKNILFFGAIALLGVFLTKQVAVPFTGIYSWLFQHFPGFDAFREASKFYYLVSLGYAVLTGSFISYIWISWKKDGLKRYVKYFLVILTVLIFLANTMPILNGSFGSIYVPRHIPSDYLVLKNSLLKDDNFSRTLWVPAYSRWGLVTNSHPAVSAIDEIYGDWNAFVKGLQNPNYVYQGSLIITLLQKQYAKDLLNESSIKYVIVPLEDKINQDDFFIYYGEPRQYYIKQLDKIPWLHRINIGTKDLVVYENYGYRPHVYITQEQETINKEQEYKRIDYKFITPSQYEVQVDNVKGPFYLNFSEAYNTGWKVRIGNFNWLNVLTKQNYFLSDKSHFENNVTLNSFRIDPEQVCKVESCKVNKDGTYDFTLTLYFAPQSWMYLGLIISGGTLVLVLGYELLVLSKYLYEKRKH